MEISLQPLSEAELRAVAEGFPPVHLLERAEHGALPPAFVAARSLAQRAAGGDAGWCSTLLMLRADDGRIVGSCGFKRMPRDGRVDIGYGVAPGCRGHGAAVSAVRGLLARAFAAGAVEVWAEVLPDNTASQRVLQKAGFVQDGTHIDEQGDLVTVWRCRNGAAALPTPFV